MKRHKKNKIFYGRKIKKTNADFENKKKKRFV
jgi:hypothetical protein